MRKLRKIKFTAADIADIIRSKGYLKSTSVETRAVIGRSRKTHEISDEIWLAHGIKPPQREYHFRASEDQRNPYRIDFCWPESMLAIEIDGGVWLKKSGHTTGTGILKDHKKRNAMVLAGWRILLYTPSTVDFAQIKEALTKNKLEISCVIKQI